MQAVPIRGGLVLFAARQRREMEAGRSGFYKTKRWERKRAAILRRDGYMCQVSKRYGKRVEANTVHHIFPRDRFPEYSWADWNLISVSHEAHNELHDRGTGQLTDKGVELMKRTARKQNIDLNEED